MNRNRNRFIGRHPLDGLNCRGYIRYSAEDDSRDEKLSAKQQRKTMEEFCTANGCTLTAIYDRDLAISGAATGNRPDYNRLLADLQAGEVLLVNDLTRLMRSVKLAWEIEQLRHRRIRVVGIQDHFDSTDPSSNLNAVFKGYEGANYRKMIGERVYATQGLIVESGRTTGGVKYGYIETYSEHPTELFRGMPKRVSTGLEVNPAEAAVIKRGFTLYAEGISVAELAWMYNKEGIISPGGTKWSSTTFDSNRKLGWGLFNNELYVGRLVWNRTHGEKDPDSGKYRYVVNPPDEWFRRDVPQLRIVSDELWEAVKRRQEAGSRAKNGIKISKTIAEGKRMGGRLPRRPLGGILKCAVCSGNIQADNTKDYICGRHSVGACSNSLRVRRELIEAAVFDKLCKHLTSKSALLQAERYIKELIAKHKREAKAARQPTAITKQIAEVKRRIADLQSLDEPEAAAPLIAKFERRLEELQGPNTSRAVRQLLPALEVSHVLEKYVQQVEQGFRALSSPEAVVKGRAAMTSLLADGIITLGPDAENEHWVGMMRLKSLGEFALEFAGKPRKMAFPRLLRLPTPVVNGSKKTTSRLPPR